MEKTDGVETFVGIDAHSRQCSIKAISRQGEALLEKDVPTRAAALKKALRGLPRPVWAMVESSYLAPLLREMMEASVDRLVVCETRENRWISHSEDKGDQADADRLSRLLRMGEFKAVHVPAGLGRDRQEVLRLYQKAQGDVIRTKNRIKGKYREHGVSLPGKRVYAEGHRKECLALVRRPQARFLLEVLYRKLEADEASSQALLNRLVGLMRSNPGYESLQGIPGLGKVLSSVVAAVIDDPNRFANKRKLWNYSGLGVRTRWSGDPSQARISGNKSGNRLLKYAALSAANAALRGENRFSRHYRKMIGEGADPAMAKRTVARKILATALVLLKTGAAYEDNQV
jgi:transposase